MSERLRSIFTLIGVLTVTALTILGGIETYNKFELSNGTRAYVEKVMIER